MIVRQHRATVAIGSAGITRLYEYDDRDRLTRVEEPGRIVENRYDAADLCVWQRVRFPRGRVGGHAQRESYVFQFKYTMKDARVHQTDTWESDAPPHRHVFTAAGYIASEAWDVESARAKTITYDRDPTTGLVSSLTLTCGSGRWQARRSLTATPATQDDVKEELPRTACVSGE